jgi:hypothetical protein
MTAALCRKSIVRMMLAWALIGLIPICQAESAFSFEKHARKIHKQLTSYPSGTYVSIAFRDGTESAGALGTLTETSFTFMNADNNASETHSYGEVVKVRQGKEYIGEGSEHHIHFRPWVPVLSAVAAGAAATAFAVR